jgi:hypothetical protein
MWPYFNVPLEGHMTGLTVYNVCESIFLPFQTTCKIDCIQMYM